MNVNAFNALVTSKAGQSPLQPPKMSLEQSENSGAEFKPVDAAKDFASTVANSERAASAYMVGKADPHSVVEAIASAELAVETAVTVRNRVVEAYQELLRMPI